VIDWKLAANVAEMVARTQPAPPGAELDHPAEFAQESERLVSGYTGLVATDPLPAAEPVDRPTWIDTNLTSLRTVLDPVGERVGAGLGPLAGAGGAVLGVEVGAISGLLAQRVLGQYEFPVLDPAAPARLLFVAPNLERAAGQLEAPLPELLRWVALHETTHALQFGGVPWLRGHLAGMVVELLQGLDVDPRRLMRVPSADDLRVLVDAFRDGGVATLALGAERRVLLDRVQAFMALLEGYAEHVMDVVGAEVIDDLPRLRAALDRRRRDRSGLLRLLERLIGFELKLRQYEQGKAFCDGVVALGGIAGLNRAWDSPEHLPTLAELADPARWLERTGGPVAA
jgi:coenzyme F420 biosynthesis associated uncharacterized protein